MIRYKVRWGAYGRAGKMLDTQARSQSCTSDYVKARRIQDKLQIFVLLALYVSGCSSWHFHPKLILLMPANRTLVRSSWCVFGRDQVQISAEVTNITILKISVNEFSSYRKLSVQYLWEGQMWFLIHHFQFIVRYLSPQSTLHTASDIVMENKNR
jgi:hypothetical protein